MPMSPRLLRPIASGLHLEAQVWRNAVIANSGTVSTATVKAVSDFCRRIDAAGIRDRFYRLNLFCGNSDGSLNAVRTPLYRGPSPGGTQYGNAIDTNNNFVAGDYSETGASGGLAGNGSTKTLRHGLLWSSVPNINDIHMSVYLRAVGNSNSLLGAYWFHSTDAAQRTSWELFSGSGAIGSTVGINFTAGSPPSLLTAVRSGSASAFVYRNATSSAESTATGSVGRDIESTLFARNLVVGAPPANNQLQETLHSSSTLGGYSLGAAMSAAQVAAYNTAMQAFQAALTRNV